MAEESNHKRALTGDRPTGRLHLGHYVGSITSRIALQEQCPSFYMIADVQALTDNADDSEKVSSNVVEVAMDNIACGIDPQKTTFFIQSQVPHIAELTVFFLNLVTLARLKRNPTVKDEMAQKGYGEDVPAGFLMYPVSQTADILGVKASVVPVGEEQLPVLEQANEIVRKFNALYGKTFDEITPVLSNTPRLMGIDGKAKMSKSLGNAIYLSDSAEAVKKKVMQMYTDPSHIRVDDPGHVERNTVFAYLDAFDRNAEELVDLKKRYEKGGLPDVDIKKRLITVLNEFITPIRARREQLQEEEIMETLKSGSEKVREIANDTLDEVKERMKIKYF